MIGFWDACGGDVLLEIWDFDYDIVLLDGFFRFLFFFGVFKERLFGGLFGFLGYFLLYVNKASHGMQLLRVQVNDVSRIWW